MSNSMRSLETETRHALSGSFRGVISRHSTVCFTARCAGGNQRASRNLPESLHDE